MSLGAEVTFMCRQAWTCMLCVVGLLFLLLCFIPTWLLCALGVILLLVGMGLMLLCCMRR